MEGEQELAIIRRAYAKQILAQVQVDNSRLEQAFAEVHREDFLGPGPWVIPRWFDEYVPTPSADPVYLYIDSVVQVIAERHLNNGQPSGHAKWIASASIKADEHIVHIDTGIGYYTARVCHPHENPLLGLRMFPNQFQHSLAVGLAGQLQVENARW